MIHKELPYNLKKDVKPVNPEGWLDLRKAFVNGVVPGDLDINESDFNGIEDPSHIGSMARDPFQAMRLKAAAIASPSQAAPADTPSGGDTK